MSIALIVERPNQCGMECLSMQKSEWEKLATAVFFPDGMGGGSSIALEYRKPGHFVFSHCGRERVGMLGLEVDLGAVNGCWKGCVAMMVAI